jgi:hypothetical protein
LEHNHQLVAPDLSKLLRSHRFFTEEEKALIRTFISVNIENRKIMACLSYLRGIEFSNFTKRNISNLRTRMRKQGGENDLTQVRQFFAMKQAEDPMFFFTFDTDEEHRVKNMLWSHGSSRANYEKYGDILSFDTTYETNRYNLNFARFVGINGHGQTILFAGAFIADETAESF